MKVIMIAAMTLCGRISPAGFGSSLDRKMLESARQGTDASLIGAGTLRAEDPALRVPAGRSAAGRQRAVISGSGRIPVDDRRLFLQGAPPVVFTSGQAADKLQHQLGERATVIGLPPMPHGLSLPAALRHLEECGASSVLIEGGGGLNFTALAQRVVDELRVTIVPRLSGHRDAVSLADGPVPLGDPFLSLELLAWERLETGELVVRYRPKTGSTT